MTITDLNNLWKSFYTVHEVLTASIVGWFATPSSSGSRFIRTLHYGPPVLGGPKWHGLWLLCHDKAVIHEGALLGQQSREFTLPTNVHIVKAMVFPVVIYMVVRVGS